MITRDRITASVSKHTANTFRAWAEQLNLPLGGLLELIARGVNIEELLRREYGPTQLSFQIDTVGIHSVIVPASSGPPSQLVPSSTTPGVRRVSETAPSVLND